MVPLLRGSQWRFSLSKGFSHVFYNACWLKWQLHIICCFFLTVVSLIWSYGKFGIKWQSFYPFWQKVIAFTSTTFSRLLWWSVSLSPFHLPLSGAFLCNVIPFWCHKTKESHLVAYGCIKLSFLKVLMCTPRQYLTENF